MVLARRLLLLVVVLLGVASALADCSSAERPTTVAAAWAAAQHTGGACDAPCHSAPPCTPATTPLPPCDESQGLLDTDGCWSDSTRVTPERLANHVQGGGTAEGLASALAWPRVWLTRSCAAPARHHTALSDASCPRLATLSRTHGTVYWLLLVGDESLRSLYCQLYSILIRGSEMAASKDSVFSDLHNDAANVGCGGLMPKAKSTHVGYGGATFDDQTPADLGYVILSGAGEEAAGKVFTFRTADLGGGRHVRVSWTYAKSLAAPEAMLGGITASLTGREGFPDDVILSSGYHDFPHSADLRRQPGGSHADAHNVFPSTGSGVAATALAAEKRREGVLEVMDHLAKATGNASRLWYRSNYCQDHFSALVADARVVPAVQQGGEACWTCSASAPRTGRIRSRTGWCRVGSRWARRRTGRTRTSTRTTRASSPARRRSSC